MAASIYRGFSDKLHHRVPPWVEPGSLFHIRIRTDRVKQPEPLTNPSLGKALLESAEFYQTQHRWFIRVFLLMPDHIHAILSFAPDRTMSQTIGEWKHFHKTKHRVEWQEGYFDHRLRDDERGAQLEAKVTYIRRNPVAAGLCAAPEDWPWVIG